MAKKKAQLTQKKERAPSGLIRLNVELQKKNIKMLESMHALTQRIDNLVSIFEEAAKNVSNVGEDQKVRELTVKLEELLEQNKSLANGLLLLERYVRSKSIETKRL